MSLQGAGEVYIVAYPSSNTPPTKPLTYFWHAGGKKLNPTERPSDWPFEPGDLPKEMVRGSVVVFIREPNQPARFGQKTPDGLAVSLHRMRYTPTAWTLVALGMIGIVISLAAIASIHSKPSSPTATPMWLWVLLGVFVTSALLGFLVFGRQNQGRILLEINARELQVPCNRQHFATADVKCMVVTEWEDTIASEFGSNENSGTGIGLRILLFLKSGERIELPTFFMDFGREKFVAAAKKIAPFPIESHNKHREVYSGPRQYGFKAKFRQPWRDSEQVNQEWK